MHCHVYGANEGISNIKRVKHVLPYFSYVRSLDLRSTPLTHSRSYQVSCIFLFIYLLIDPKHVLCQVIYTNNSINVVPDSYTACHLGYFLLISNPKVKIVSAKPAFEPEEKHDITYFKRFSLGVIHTTAASRLRVNDAHHHHHRPFF